MKAKLGYVDADDGSFWMSFDDFVLNYVNLYCCRIFDDSWCQKRVTCAWRGETAGGCSNFDSYESNPQFYLNVSVPTTVNIVLAQTDQRGSGRENLHIGFNVLDKKGRRTKGYTKQQVIADSGTFTNSREVTCEVELQPHSEPYTLVPSTFDPGEENDFTITVFSKGSRVTFPDRPISTDVPAVFSTRRL